MTTENSSSANNSSVKYQDGNILAGAKLDELQNDAAAKKAAKAGDDCMTVSDTVWRVSEQ